MIDLDTPIEKLELSRRAYNGLHFDNIETVGQLVALTRADLLRSPRIGKWCLEEIEDVLACHGFKIKPYGEARPIGKPRGTWRLIETAPRDGTPILACLGPFMYIVFWSDDSKLKSPIPWWEMGSAEWENNKWIGYHEEYYAASPTHWMHLPDLPK